MTERRLMSVRSELVQETIVATICERALARSDSPLPEPVAAVLDAVARPDLARAGYFVRVTETDLFEPARRPAAWLADQLDADAGENASPWPAAVAALAARLSEGEPGGRPDPDDADAVSWRIPGPGGHVRHYVALRLAGAQEPALKRNVIYGVLVRCCEETRPA